MHRHDQRVPRTVDNANGLARDAWPAAGLRASTRRVTRTEYDGSITVLADRFDGKRLNSPNDIVCARDGSIWFTDPLFGIAGHWEGEPAAQRDALGGLPHRPGERPLPRVIDDLAAPNGLAFTPDERGLYVVESRAEPHRRIWPYDVAAAAALSNKRLFVDAQGPGAYDGIAVDALGNVWCGFGSSSGRADLPSWTACASTTSPAGPSATSTCPSAAPTCASAGGSATGCSWPPAIRCTRCTSTCRARAERPTRSPAALRGRDRAVERRSAGPPGAGAAQRQWLPPPPRLPGRASPRRG